MPDISAVILTFNAIKFIKPCLDSLYSQSGDHNIEVIVVDNGSADGTAGFVSKNYPRVILIANKVNAGSSAGRNQGISVARGKWVLTLDCDVVLEKSFLGRISAFISQAPDNIGMVAPKILTSDKRTIYSCGIYLSWFRKFYDLGKGRIAGYDSDRGVFGACSAAALYRMEMLERIKEDTGYFDERFFFLVEDVDLSWRGRRNGWQAWFLAAAVCYHQGNSSLCGSKARQYLCMRNRYYMIKKNEGVTRYLCRVLPVLFYDLPRGLAMLALNRNRTSPGSATRAGLPPAGKR
jgi:GT2 family glycosyltransferase